MPHETEVLTLQDGYSRAKMPPVARFRPMTPAEAIEIGNGRGGQEIPFTGPERKTFRRCRRNGAVKTWKTRPDVELPVKYGMYECARATSEGDRDTGTMRLPNGGILLVTLDEGE